jgi:hypothetical protein
MGAAISERRSHYSESVPGFQATLMTTRVAVRDAADRPGGFN